MPANFFSCHDAKALTAAIEPIVIQEDDFLAGISAFAAFAVQPL